MTPVPFNDLGRVFREQEHEIRSVVDEVLAAGRYVHGPRHHRFEKEFAAWVGTEHCIGVGNGTDALSLALIGIRGDEARDTVLTAANAGGYTTAAALAAGLRVAYADVDPETHCIDPQLVRAALREDASIFAVVSTHLYGRLADVEALGSICEDAGVALVEDCAQAAGATREGRGAGSFGTAATFSFYPTKNLGALGDGGAVVTSDERLADRIRRLRQYGWGQKYRVELAHGRNSRLDEIQAAVLSVRLPRLAQWNARRRDIIGRYRAAASPGLVSVLAAEDASHAGHLAVLETDARDELRDHLHSAGVGTEIHYPVPDHQQGGAWRRTTVLPVTEDLAGRVLSLPCFPQLTDDEVDRVCEALNAFRGGGR